MEFLHEYGLFLAQAVTLVAAILILVAGLISIGQRQRAVQHEGHIEVRSLNEKYSHFGDTVRCVTESPELVKARRKEDRKAE